MFRLARLARNEGGLIHQIIVIAGISVLSGVLMAGLALPWVGLISKGAENSAHAVKNFPLELKFKPLDERTRVLASDGTPLAVFYDQNRKYVPLSRISDNMRRAIIAIEDARYYEHGAIDVRGTLRAFIVNEVGGGVIQGGSSITQQLVKLTRVQNADTPAQRAAATADTKARKLQELRYAVWVEDHLNKDQILEHYLNTAYYGDGAYGIEAAAHHYFSTSAMELTLAQAAMLAGLVKNPTTYDPTNSRTAARNRRNTVINRMLELHVITTARAHKAKRSKLGLHVTHIANGCVNSRAPFFCDYMLQYLLASPALGKTVEERRHRVFGGGLTIRTTVDLRFQKAADTSVANHVYARDNAIGGLAMVEPGTGYVRALAQSRPMGRDKKKGETFLNYVVPKRYGDSAGFQPGSTFKVFVLAQAIRQGIPLNTSIYAPHSLSLPNNQFKVCGGHYLRSSDTWNVSNSTTDGTMNLYTGTQNSVNTFFAQLEQRTGLCGPWRLATNMGIELEDPDRNMVPPFTLGVSDVSPLEMAEAYATFAARGRHCASTPILEIRDRNGDVIPTPGTTCLRVLRPAYADAVNDILKGVMAPGGFGQDLALNQPSAGKTGTTQSTKAVWFVGYTPSLAAASMIAGANQQGHPTALIGTSVHGVVLYDASGSGTAGPMWGDAMRAVEGWLPDRDFHSPDLKVVQGQTVSIPSFYGYDPSHAAQELTRLGFNPQISYSVSSSAPAGTVAYTSPSYQGTTGETVYIYISTGYVPPPPTYSPPSTPPSNTPQPSPPPTRDHKPEPHQPKPNKPGKPR